MALVLALLLAHAFSAAAADTPGLPPAVAAQLPEVRIRGGGELTFLGLSIYDARLFRDTRARGEVSTDERFALELIYKRRLYGTLIADRSVEEMTKLGYGSEEQRARWGARLKKILRDVDDGDSITGVNLPKRAVRFYKNGAPIGTIDDPEFARAFFAIWFDPRTSEPVLRKQLLGEAP
ncbi:MAG: chalcone isomerase family protein [Betaproteobacteria bacterium]